MLYRKIVATFLAGSLLLLAASSFAAQESSKATLINTKGKGTIKVGKESFPLYAVVLNLKEDNKLEITLIADITLFFEGSWSKGNNPGEPIELKIKGQGTGSIEGSGKAFLRADGQAITRLNLKASNKFRPQVISVDFSGS